MERSSFSNRHFAGAISAGLLSIVLLSKQGEPDSRPLGVSSAERNRGNHLREGPDEDGEPDTGTGTSADDRQPP